MRTLIRKTHKNIFGIVIGMVLATVAIAFAATPNVKNYFEACKGSNCDNVLHVTGTIKNANGDAVDLTAVGVSTSAVTAELNRLASVTPGTLSASKAVVVDSSSKIDTWDATVLKANGVTITNAVAGIAASYKVARGETALDGSNPTPVSTSLTTITGCSLTLKTTSAPGVSTSVLSYGTSSGTLNMYGWKVTGTGDATLIASTGTDTIGWVCVGT